MVTDKERNRFSLGFEGEVWHYEIESITLPLSDRCDIMVTKDGPDFIVAHRNRETGGHIMSWSRFDNLLMAACYVKDTMDNWPSE